MSFTVIIPARYASSRLPGKPLADIAGEPMILHVWRQSLQSGASRVIVATDHQDVFDVVKKAGGEVCLTQTHHQSGTERLAEVIKQYNMPSDEVIVNVQGDEPLIPPQIIQQVADNLVNFDVKMATLAVKIEDREDIFNPNAVKVVIDKKGYALYFSRAPIPWDRDCFEQEHSSSLLLNHYLRHIGIYAYRAGFIENYLALPTTELENIERLEQLRVLWHGEKIHVAIANSVPAAGVDTYEDLERVRAYLLVRN